MPPKRKSAGAAPKSTQSTLAFHGASNKVTKAGSRAANAKKNILAEPAKKEEKSDVADVRVKKEETPDVAGVRVKEEETPTTAEAAIIEQTEKVQEATQSTPEEDEARRITTKQLQKWLRAQNPGKAPTAHQGDLSLEERILRKFDMSGQYGPCVGIARLKRWQRANRLDLDPPIEVLAVLLREQEGKDKVSVQRSYVDELLNSRAETALEA